MTVSNVLLEAGRVRLISDTLGYIGKEPACLNRKIRVVKKAKLAFVVRGRRLFADALEDMSPYWSDLADARVSILDALASCNHDYFSQLGLVECTIAAWADRGARAERIVANLLDGKVRINRHELQPGAYLAPFLGNHSIPETMSYDQIFRVSLLQQDIAVRHNLNMCIGGDVEVAEVTADGVRLRSLGAYPDKWATVAQIRAADVPYAMVA